ncbi:hypothetical protein [Nocardia brevicatena]|uniref:hypothetical protein n=1 Tax=Nocardia brevicatena TaxID=37327 RepID=UPI0012FC5EB2|nr:hypothetical protein [Nocardia brevicatena]
MTKWAKAAGPGNDTGPLTTAETVEELRRVEGEDSAYRPGPGVLEKVDAALERQPGSAADVLDSVMPIPLETTHAEGRPDQGAERDGAIAADPDPRNDAQEQAVHQGPEPVTDNADPAGSESVQLSSTATAVDPPEGAQVAHKRTPRLRALVTTMSEKVRALGNLVKVYPGR